MIVFRVLEFVSCPTTVKEVQRFLGFANYSEVYPGFWSGSGSHYLTAEVGSGATAVVSWGGQGFWSPEGFVYLGSRAGSS